MIPIGGEIPHKRSNYKSYFTDSGRSSMRLFFRSNNYRNKKVLLPDFFCDIIEQVLQEEQIIYEFYKVNTDFSINQQEINQSKFDILYVINYFGSITSLKKINLDDKILIEDNVFSIQFKNYHNAKKWFAFNSYRKITALTDGSLIKTNININSQLILNSPAPYTKVKTEACNIKHLYLTKHKFTEKEYLDAFNKGEELINAQNKIYTISPNSLFLLHKIKKNNIEKKRFNKLKHKIGFSKSKPKYYSFFTFNIENKDKFISEMRNHNIFLPHFWQKTSANNVLYNELIAIPLFSNYSDKEFMRIFNTIIKYQIK